MFARGYFPGRSGQVFYVPHEGDFVVNAGDDLEMFVHGSPWEYDTHIPLLFHGSGFIRQGTWSDPVVQQDVAPTLARLLAVRPGPTTTGRVLEQAIELDAPRPRVIAVVVLDGMRADYFETYRDVMPVLTRLRAEGAWFARAGVNSLPTATSGGHATLGTGTDPRVHGIVVNRLFSRITRREQEVFHELDPRELMALTLADLWNLATDGRARIVALGGAIRAAAGLAGRGACLVNGRPVTAASYSAQDGGWETNPMCYAMPDALGAIAGEQYWQAAGGAWMGHDIASPSRFRYSGLFARFEGDALAAVLEREPLGADGITDLVLVNFKSPDYVGHAFGPASREIRETLIEVDRQLGRALRIIEEKAGPGGSVVAVTADHGMPGEPPAGRRRITLREVADALNQQFSPASARRPGSFGPGVSIVEYFNSESNAQIHLDTARLDALGHSVRDVAAFLESRFFAAAFTEDEVRAAQTRLPLGR
ncbi:MAG: hypothetical protein A3H29_01635 [Acidobacteria bacterium RIFCSPLOWO2_02_FULL_67_21]|nr:MAG: hypothetical protein A3H29_01635 [Acidobacteria bacterium RIFCSPLOWO2_02_FULL_67_21]